MPQIDKCIQIEKNKDAFITDRALLQLSAFGFNLLQSILWYASASSKDLIIGREPPRSAHFAKDSSKSSETPVSRQY